MISEIEHLTLIVESQWHHVTDMVRALFDGGWRAKDGVEAFVAEYDMTPEEAKNTVLGLEALEAMQKMIRARADAREAWVEGAE